MLNRKSKLDDISKEKPKLDSSSLKKLVKYSKKHRPMFFVAVLIAIIGTILSVISPRFLANVTDIITSGLSSTVDMKAITNISIMLFSFYGLSFIFSSFQGVIMTNISQNITKSLRRDLSKKINKIPLNYFDTTSIGNIMSRVSNDVDLIGQMLNQSVVNALSASIMFIGTLLMMFLTNWVMAISAVLSTILGFALMSIIIKKSQKFFKMQQKTLGELNGHIEETYSSQNVIKVYNAEEKEILEFKKLNDKLYSSAWKSQFMSGLMQPLMAFVGNLGYVVVCIIGALLALNGYITFGVIVAFMMYVRLFTQPLAQLAQAATTLQTASAASFRVFEFLEEDEVSNENESREITKTSGHVSFNNVKFGYTPEKTIIKDFSIDIKSGQKIAIVGPTGAGKSTIINLLMRFYELDSGKILIDDEDISKMSYFTLRQKFCMVLQDTWLFEGTVRENIIYSNQNITDDELISVCKSVGIHHFIKTLPQGYDTVLNEATTISAGQKQLITIARAMLSHANMLILDEATSSVDTRTELLIQNAMDKLMVGKTSFVIAHRLSTIKNSDVILVLKDGDILESGNHEKLMAKNGFYANLYNSQFESA